MAWYEPSFSWRGDPAAVADIFTAFSLYLPLFAFICFYLP
jgi:hypothetical protein